MRLAERVTARDERYGLLIVHRHAAERGTNVLRGSHVVAALVRTLRVHIDETHVRSPERQREIAIAGETLIHAEPLDLRAPVHVLIRLPHVRTAATETERPEAHRLQRDVTGEDQEIGPRDFLAVLLFDRPQQAPRLVDVDVVGPAVERGEALLAATAAAATVLNTIRAGRVPGHTNELRAVVAEVGRPPGLRVRH